jgi:hypothetical protein
MCILLKGLSTVFGVQEKFELAARVRLQCTLYYNLGEGGTGYLTL